MQNVTDKLCGSRVQRSLSGEVCTGARETAGNRHYATPRVWATVFMLSSQQSEKVVKCRDYIIIYYLRAHFMAHNRLQGACVLL